ncbi:MAG: Asp-tRNA(Asn)/Glu-tRNA(Gln) amidotransferase subunit GatC [Gemmatimonadota bacterium]
MAVSEEQVRRIADLARLKPDGAAIARLTGELNGILEHVRALERLDVEGPEDTVHGSNGAITYRDPDLEPDGLVAGAPGDRAPDWRNGFFVVPRLPALDGGADEDRGAP